MSREVRFREVQQFRQLWLWALLAVSLAPVAVLGVFGVTLVVVIVALVWRISLTTEVRADGLYVKFWPFHRTFRHVAWDEIESVEAVRYRPIRDYGGWGLRWRPGKLAYNVSGSRGVVLTRAEGRELMVGSQRPDELAAAIRAASTATD